MTKYTEFEVKGTPSYTLNLLIKSGVNTREVSVDKLYARFKVSNKESQKAQKVLEKAHREYKILSEDICANRARNRIKYASFVIGVMVSVVFIFSYSFLIFSVNIIGVKNVSEEEIFFVLEQYGKGVFLKSEIELNNLEKELVNIPNVSHAKATIKGNALNIEIVEQLSNTEILEPQTMGNIISKENAIITKMVVVSGTPVVKVGDSVKKGQVLIEATKSDINGEPVPCPTEAVIEGRIWHQEKFSISGEPNAQTVDGIERRKQEFIMNLPKSAQFVKSWYFVKRLDNASIISIYYEIINTIV